MTQLLPFRISLRSPQRLARQQARYSSIQPSKSLINVKNVAAPHYGSIRILSLNRPEARNALSRALLERFSQEIDEVKSEQGIGSTRALILASELDNCFCAGADLKERITFTKAQTTAFLTNLRNAFTNLSKLEIPTISAVSSVALGGGLELALCTHFRVFASTSTVGLPETRLAIIPGAGGTFRLPGVIGLQRARDMILTGRRVSGVESYFMGLCDRLIEIPPGQEEEPGKARERVLEESIKLARDICEGGPIGTQQALRAVNGWMDGEAAEKEPYEVVLDTDDRVEALKAFAEKRNPIFKGRHSFGSTARMA